MCFICIFLFVFLIYEQINDFLCYSFYVCFQFFYQLLCIIYINKQSAIRIFMWHLRYDFIDNEVYSWFYWSSTTRKDNRNAAELKIYTKKIRLDFIPNDEKLNCEPKRKKKTVKDWKKCSLTYHGEKSTSYLSRIR